ncbi:MULTISPECIES: diguanylate cyclase domain-containing protein [Pectobacterium]|uniref:diguanylate cyclase domain-containing protein n=1 Tax=Pectobacterium TaxID=122277 RepID=UPI0015DFB38C|nr:diguanylate cyclase [Pectobacterium sp. CFBP8739]MBA0166828.1 diguanylate cyclase [Pectobacterium sp. CFBP8739]
MPYIAQLISNNLPRGRLLVVDDQPTNIWLIYETFQQQYDIFMATNGEDAINQVKSNQPDLILLDVVMPGIDGYEVCRRLKSDPMTAGIPVIFVTAQRSEYDEVRGFEIGAVDFITKPVNPVIVKARVTTHMALKRQSDLLRSIAMLDGLTGVANRRKFDETLGHLWFQCQRDKKPMSLIILDVDYFKRYNDTYGHQSGDDCLRSLANEFRRALQRPQDLIARIGGEEFACILPWTDAIGAMAIAERIKNAVHELSLEHKASPIGQIVTVSMGLVTRIPEPDMDSNELIALADQALYRQKANGRDGFCVI